MYRQSAYVLGFVVLLQVSVSSDAWAVVDCEKIRTAALVESQDPEVLASAVSAKPFEEAMGAGEHSWILNSEPLKIRKLDVTSLDDYLPNEPVIPGTLRWAVEQTGPRMVRLRKSGVIKLKGDLLITHPYLYLDGTYANNPDQGGSDEGVTISEFSTWIRNTHHIVLQNLRFRMGSHQVIDSNGILNHLARNRDAMTIENSFNVMIYKTSFSWSSDEVFSIAAAYPPFKDKYFGECEGSFNITLQESVVAEGIEYLDTLKTQHWHNSRGSIISGAKAGRISLVRNAFLNNKIRNVRLASYGPAPDSSSLPRHRTQIDWINNVVFNSDNLAGSAAYFGCSPAGSSVEYNWVLLNMQGNVYRPGPNTGRPDLMYASLAVSESSQFFLRDNQVIYRSAKTVCPTVTLPERGLDLIQVPTVAEVEKAVKEGLTCPPPNRYFYTTLQKLQDPALKKELLTKQSPAKDETIKVLSADEADKYVLAFAGAGRKKAIGSNTIWVRDQADQRIFGDAVKGVGAYLKAVPDKDLDYYTHPPIGPVTELPCL